MDPVMLSAALVSLAIGGYSVHAGRKLRDPANAASKQFTVLIWIFGASVALGVIGDIATLVQGERLTGVLGYLIPIWAIVKFSRGR